MKNEHDTHGPITPLARRPRPRTSPSSPAMVRAVFGALSRTAPRLAARAASRTFVRPPRPRWPAREREARAEAVVGWRSTPVGLIRVYRWRRGPFLPWENRTPAGRILLLHGWGGRGTQLAAFVEPLRAAGFEVWAFDAPGHGASPGSQLDLRDYVEVVHALDEAEGPFAGAIAHSMGCGALSVAMAEGFSAGRAVFVGGPSRLGAVSAHVSFELGLTPRAAKGFEDEITRRLGVESFRRFDVATHVDALADRAALVIHDVDDTEVLFEEGQRLARVWPGARLVATAGLGHRRILRDPMVVLEAARFFGEPFGGIAGYTRNPFVPRPSA